MKEKKIDRWEDFEIEISSIFESIKKKRAETRMPVSHPLFRGHANACWKLETTLERYTARPYTMRDYYKVIRAVRPAVESFTERSWNLSDDYDDYDIDEEFPCAPPGYDFMIYLRHHGFPSPLLDWTRSPYIAAFFAFHSKAPSEDKSVAIYSYVEYYEGVKTWSGDEATIVGLGPYVTTHKRHYNQQSEYTICKKFVSNKYIYCNHKEAFESNEIGQDLLTKYLITRSERAKVLERLNIMNINSYSLFGHEESLMETLAYQEIEKNRL